MATTEAEKAVLESKINGFMSHMTKSKGDPLLNENELLSAERATRADKELANAYNQAADIANNPKASQFERSHSVLTAYERFVSKTKDTELKQAREGYLAKMKKLCPKMLGL